MQPTPVWSMAPHMISQLHTGLIPEHKHEKRWVLPNITSNYSALERIMFDYFFSIIRGNFEKKKDKENPSLIIFVLY